MFSSWVLLKKQRSHAIADYVFIEEFIGVWWRSLDRYRGILAFDRYH